MIIVQKLYDRSFNPSLKEKKTMKTPNLTFKKEVKSTHSDQENTLNYPNKTTPITSFIKLSNLVSLDLKKGKIVKNMLSSPCNMAHK